MIDTKLKGKVAIVTGANNPYGIGAGIAKALALEQVKVFLQYFRVNVDNNKKLKEPDAPGEEFYNFQRQKDTYEILTAIKQNKGQAYEYECDLSKPEAIRDLFNKAEAVFGPVNILINNAAHWEPDTFLFPKQDLINKFVEKWTSAPRTITDGSFDRLFAVNTKAVALLMTEFAKKHIEREASWGRIINISTDGAYCFPSEISYGASKLALEGYSRSAATELGQFGITVNIISPGAVQTGWITPEMESEITSSYPLKRIGKPEDIADVVVFLASEQARWVTGQKIYVGGGHAM